MDLLKEKREDINRRVRVIRNKKYYEESKEKNKLLCECCQCYINKYGWKKHEESNKHRIRKQLQEQHSKSN